MEKFSLQTGRSNKVLHTLSVPVKSISKETKKLMKEMKNYIFITMEKQALGLAAPQIGSNIRVIFTYIEKKWIFMVNPEITFISDEKNVDEEGCLSVPGEYGKVWRYTDIEVSFVDEKELRKKRVLSGLDARIVQHEVDHLDGILFVERMLPEDIEVMEKTKK